jgi:hypothetical protein
MKLLGRKCLFCGQVAPEMVEDRQEEVWMCMACADSGEAAILLERFPTAGPGIEPRFRLHGGAGWVSFHGPDH